MLTIPRLNFACVVSFTVLWVDTPDSLAIPAQQWQDGAASTDGYETVDTTGTKSTRRGKRICQYLRWILIGCWTMQRPSLLILLGLVYTFLGWECRRKSCRNISLRLWTRTDFLPWHRHNSLTPGPERSTEDNCREWDSPCLRSRGSSVDLS